MIALYEPISHKSRDGMPLKIYTTTGVGLHWHNEYEFILVENGSALCMIDGQPLELTKGKAILVQSGVPHSVLCKNNGAIKAVVTSPAFWSNDRTDSLFDGRISWQTFFDCANPKEAEIIGLLNEVIKLYDSSDFGYEFIMKTKFSQLFTVLINEGLFSHTPKQRESIPQEFKGLVAYIHNNYADKITLNTLSSISFYSATYIIKLFKLYTNLTPIEYITQYRLELAKRRLKENCESNLDIAVACGFSSESYFIYTFKKHYGMTPHAYRKWQFK